MSFLKKTIQQNTSVEPLNDEIKQKITGLVTDKLVDYEKNYRNELQNVYKEWTNAGKNYTFPELDREAHNRAGVKSFKETVSETTWNDVKNDVDKEVKSKTKVDLVIKASNTAGKKAVQVMVDKSVDEGLKKMSKKAEEENKK